MDEAATTSNRGDGPVDLYREVHKGLRLALFDLTAAAGSLDRSDETGAKAFATLFADVEMMLETHHAHEDGEHLAGLIDRHAPEAAIAVADAHDEISSRLTDLRGRVVDAAGGAAGVYDFVARFTADYLDHMQVEETVVMPALQRAVPAEELMAITMEIRTSVPPPQMCVFLRYMLPAMTPDERTATLGGMKAGAPPEIFELFWGVARTHLSPDDLETVARRIAA